MVSGSMVGQAHVAINWQGEGAMSNCLQRALCRGPLRRAWRWSYAARSSTAAPGSAASAWSLVVRLVASLHSLRFDSTALHRVDSGGAGAFAAFLLELFVQ